MQPKHSIALGRDHYLGRVEAIRAYLDSQRLDGFLLLDAANVMWASGFFHIPNERPLALYVPLRGAPTFFVPLLEKEQAEAVGLAEVRHYWEYPGEVPPELWMLDQIGPGRVGVDAAGYELFTQMLALNPDVRVDHGVAQMRYLKSEAELALTELAAGYADYGLEVARRAVAAGLRDGITEIDVVRAVQAETTEKMKRELADLTNFYRGAVSLTAHAGPRGALPHGQPGPHQIRPGDTLIVGIGARVGGYHAESGCTFVVGDPSADQRRCLEATWACDEAALAALRPGATCGSVNEAALAVLREAGFGEHIRHRIGHGMGVQGHEAPWLSVGDVTLMQPTMVFSNEPGIYRPGVDGYRIIDTMVVTAAGGRRLSRYLSAHGPDDRVIPA
jgi:Xaa-Pro aminopeptidase